VVALVAHGWGGLATAAAARPARSGLHGRRASSVLHRLLRQQAQLLAARALVRCAAAPSRPARHHDRLGRRVRRRCRDGRRPPRERWATCDRPAATHRRRSSAARVLLRRPSPARRPQRIELVRCSRSSSSTNEKIEGRRRCSLGLARPSPRQRLRSAATVGYGQMQGLGRRPVVSPLRRSRRERGRIFSYDVTAAATEDTRSTRSASGSCVPLAARARSCTARSCPRLTPIACAWSRSTTPPTTTRRPADPTCAAQDLPVVLVVTQPAFRAVPTDEIGASRCPSSKAGCQA